MENESENRDKFEDGCELVSVFLGAPVLCGKCPVEKCINDAWDDAMREITALLVKAKQQMKEPAPLGENPRGEPSMKGRWCPYNARIFCQEGNCRECGIYESRKVGNEN